MPIALVDCNNFFVSCERAFRPSLEGRSVVVLSGNDGVVISRSEEAKALGIGMAQDLHRIPFWFLWCSGGLILGSLLYRKVNS